MDVKQTLSLLRHVIDKNQARYRLLNLKHFLLSFFCGIYIHAPYLCKDKLWGQKEYYQICKCYQCFTRDPVFAKTYGGNNKDKIKFYKIWRFYINKDRVLDPIINWFLRTYTKFKLYKKLLSIKIASWKGRIVKINVG